MIVYWIELTNERLGAGQYDVKNREWSSLTKMMEMIPLGMVAVDRSGNIIAFNQPLIRGFRNVFPNLSTKDVIGRPLFDLLDGMIQKNICAVGFIER